MTGHALPRLTEEQFRLSTAERAAGTGSSNRKGRLPRRVLLVLVAGPIGQWRATSASSRNFGEFSRNCKRLKCASSHNFRRKFIAPSSVDKIRRERPPWTEVEELGGIAGRRGPATLTDLAGAKKLSYAVRMNALRGASVFRGWSC
jgi:hypothetical protein